MSRHLLFPLLLLFAAGGCSSNDQPKEQSKAEQAAPPKKAEDPAEYITGREAFQKLYLAARNWSPDSRPVKLESRPRKSDKRDGTASVWVASFASAQRGQIRSFMWSGAAGEDAPERGITPGSQDTFSPGNLSTQPFDPAFIGSDTPSALKTADKKAPAAAKKDKEGPVKFLLFNDTQKQRLLWRVIYGNSETNNHGSISINARDGGFVKVDK